MTWPPPRDEAAEKARFIEIYGEELWNEIQELGKPKPLAEREVMRPRRPQPATTPSPATDRPALQTEDSDDPQWWENK